MRDKPLVLIMCGGRSLRLWPLSEYKSKNFIDIFGFSPLELTIKRFLKITSCERIFLAANIREKKALSKIKSIPRNNIIYEPNSKNTAAAVCLSVLTLNTRFNQIENLIISPVDNFVDNEKEFYASVNLALTTAGRGLVCVIGTKADKPISRFGYIQSAEQEKSGVFLVKRFIEKPPVSIAKKLIAAGNVFYNSGMVIARMDILQQEFAAYYNDYEKFSSIHSLSARYKQLTDISFDKAILEKTKRIRLVKGKYRWYDFGSWDTVYEVLPHDADGNMNKAGAFMYAGHNNCVYQYGFKKKILMAGLNNVLFVDTPDYVLLASKDYIDNLKSIVKQFKQE